MQPIDLTGQRFGHLLVTDFSHTSPAGVRYWVCQCDCGTIKAISGKNLKSGQISCGCVRKEMLNNGYSDTLTIDRINPEGNYEPSNCRWATTKEQANNKRKKRVQIVETNRDKLNRLCMRSDVDTIMNFAKSEGCDCCDRFCEKNLSPTQPSCEGRWCEEAIPYWLEEYVKGDG